MGHTQVQTTLVYVQVTPLADGLALVLTLLPAVQAVLGGAVLLVAACLRFIVGVLGLQAVLERIQHLRNMIVELGARNARWRGQLRIEFDRAHPGAQDLLAPGGEVRRQCRQFRFDVHRLAHRGAQYT